MRKMIVSLSLVFLSFLPATHVSAQTEEEYLKKGITQLKEENFEDAEKFFSQAIQINPKMEQAYFYRGQARYELGEYNGPQGALFDFSKVLEINPKNHEALLARGMANFDLDDMVNSLKDFDDLIKMKQDIPLAWYMRAVVHFYTNKSAAGCVDIKKAIELQVDVSEFRGFEDPQDLVAQYCK